MQTSQKFYNDYKPAELKINKEWFITFYVFDPINEIMVRKRKRVPPHRLKSERLKTAKKMLREVNYQLKNGWNPAIKPENEKSLTKISKVIDEYIAYIDHDYNSELIRKDTRRTYISVINNFTFWLKKEKLYHEFVIQFQPAMVSDFLDYIYIGRKNSTRTYNNYLIVLRLLSNFMLKKGYIKENPLLLFKNKKRSPKTRSLIEKHEIKSIFTVLDDVHSEFALICRLIYYCYIRPTELSRLKVKDVLIQDRLIYLSPENSKKTHGYITVPTNVMQQLALHIRKANSNEFLFSRSTCKTGIRQASNKYYYDHWKRYIMNKGLTKNPLYSLKDSGITFALDNGVSPVSVMNQARHTDLSTTTAYLRKPQRKADENILSADW